MVLKRLFQRCSGDGARPGFPWIALVVLFLCACGDGATPLLSAPVVPVSPAVPAAAANSVFVATPAEGEILAYVGQPRVITLEFRASEDSASGLTLSLPSLPGWRAANEALHCAAVTTAGACRLQIIYTPTAPVASSSLRFFYAYTDSTGASREGAYTLAYRVLPANTVVISQRPAGVLRGIAGRSSPLTLEFETSDGEPAASLEVSTHLASLPAGWKSDKDEFTCAGLGRGQLCRLTLVYSPIAAQGESSFDLAYSYVDSSGALRSGTANLAYSAIRPGSVIATLDASGPLLVRPGERKEITVRFEAGDGARASALRLGADPANTPGWSIRPGWQGCATVEGSDSCSLTLVFAPSLVLGPGTLSLPYTYVDNIGEARSGSVDIDYASRLYEAYIADYSNDASGGVRLCTIDVDGGLSHCTAAPIDLPGQGRSISHILANGRQAYVSSLAAGERSSVYLCAMAADGALKDCRETGGVRTGVRRLALHGASAYLLTGDGRILRQDVDVASGEIMPCPADRGNCVTAGTGTPVVALGFAGTKAYIARPGSEPAKVEGIQCGITADGDLDCSGPAFLSGYHFAAGGLATFQDGTVSRVYIVGEPYYHLLDGRHDVIRCDVLADATVGRCKASFVATLASPARETAAVFRDMTFDNMHAYIVQEANIFRCDISASDGQLPNCNALGGTGATRHFALSINRIN